MSDSSSSDDSLSERKFYRVSPIITRSRNNTPKTVKSISYAVKIPGDFSSSNDSEDPNNSFNEYNLRKSLNTPKNNVVQCRRSTRLQEISKLSSSDNSNKNDYSARNKKLKIDTPPTSPTKNKVDKELIACCTPKKLRIIINKAVEVTPRTKLSKALEKISICSTTRRSILKKNSSNQTPRKSVRYADASPVTPKKKIFKINWSDDEDENPPQKTPKKTITKITRVSLTPSMQKRCSKIIKGEDSLSTACIQLHVSYTPKNLPCREKEYSDIYNFLKGKLEDEIGGCMYVSGVPGTGKTATVTEVIRNLKEKSYKGDCSEFSFVSINGMKLSEPRQAYVEIVKQLNGKSMRWEQAQTELENKFSKASKNSKPVILVVDELDILCTKRQDVVYNLLDWPTKSHAQLIVITIANTMDLPERLLMSRVTSRLGLTRLTFQPYNFKQLQEIIAKRLIGTNIFNLDAVQLVARKVASVSGDARRALDICRRAAEMAQQEGPETLVDMKHVSIALNSMITQPKIQAISHCSLLEKILLKSVLAEVERTGVEETKFHSVYIMFKSVAIIEGFRSVPITVVLSAVMRLSSCRLLLVDKSGGIHKKIILNVSGDDVYYALNDKTIK